MKKIISLTLMIITALAINAQINTRILGVTLGQSTKQQVRSAMKQKGYRCIEFADGGLGIQPRNGLYFGGQLWEVVFFWFYNNKLSTIGFEFKGYNSDEYFELLKEKLYNKYSKYYTQEMEETIFFEDNKSRIILDVEDGYILRLDYSNKRLSALKEQSQENEL